MKRKRNGFTLIELIAVLVIMAIIALIATPLVMSIIRKARVSADKRSIDAYGRSIELAIAGYLLDNGKFPTEVSQLTIEYSGNEVVCETTQINSDSSVYLAGCTVGGRSVEYTYGTDKSPSYAAYQVGDTVTYNEVDYYVIKNSGVKEENITLLKADPLTTAEVNQYGGVGTENNHVNQYTSASVGTAYDVDGYGGMAYYSSPTCGSSGTSGCTTDYEQSEIKYVVDAWKTDQAPQAINARLITVEEIMYDLGVEMNKVSSTKYDIVVTDDTPTWIMSEKSSYWTMTTDTDKTTNAWVVHPRSYECMISSAVRNTGFIMGTIYHSGVRPVITIKKSAL